MCQAKKIHMHMSLVLSTIMRAIHQFPNFHCVFLCLESKLCVSSLLPTWINVHCTTLLATDTVLHSRSSEHFKEKPSILFHVEDFHVFLASETLNWFTCSLISYTEGFSLPWVLLINSFN